MSGAMPWLKIAGTFVGFVGGGYLLMKAVTPTPEQLYEKMSPEVRRKVDASRAQRLLAEEAARRQALAQSAQSQADDPDSQKPVWADQRR